MVQPPQPRAASDVCSPACTVPAKAATLLGTAVSERATRKDGGAAGAAPGLGEGASGTQLAAPEAEKALSGQGKAAVAPAPAQ